MIEFDGIKVGDVVVTSEWDGFHIRKVKRVTLSQFMTDTDAAGTAYWKSTGRKVGTSNEFRSYQAHKPTSEMMDLAAQDSKKRRKNFLVGRIIKEVPDANMDTLEKIFVLLRGDDRLSQQQ